MAIKTFMACYPCLLRQTIEAIGYLGLDETGSRELMKETLQIMATIEGDLTSSEVAAQIHQNIIKKGKGEDPYKAVKLESFQRAAKYYEYARELIENSINPLEKAVKVCTAGNIIDYGPTSTFDLKETLDEALQATFQIFDFEAFTNRIENAERILFLADNAGETVFDRLLIEQIKKPLFYVVKEGPIMNDATYEDAERTDFPEYVSVIDNGTSIQGTILHRISPEFRELFDSADMIIAKGMANFETLPDEKDRAFFLLKIKCQPVAEMAGIPYGAFVVKQGGIYH